VSRPWRVVNTGGGCECLCRDLDDLGWDGDGRYLLCTGGEGEGLPIFPGEVLVGRYDEDNNGEDIYRGCAKSVADLERILNERGLLS